jgi:hypothetical protein
MLGNGGWWLPGSGFMPPPPGVAGAARGRAQQPSLALDPQQEPDEYLFRPVIGDPVQDRADELNDVLERLDFRGTMGTYDHAQTAGALLIPVTTTVRGNHPATGFVGRKDRVAVMQPQSGDVAPNWYTVEWAQAPYPRARVRSGVTYFAFDAHPGIPYLATTFESLDAEEAADDLRNFARLVKFPSGERPLNLESVTVGSDVAQSARFDGWVDEVSVHTLPGNGTVLGPLGRASYALSQQLTDFEESALHLSPFFTFVDGYISYAPTPGVFLQQWPASGMIEVDGERIAYSEVSASDGRITLAPNGRGLHGTERRAHSAGARVFAADGRFATMLQGEIAPGENVLPVDDSAPFAPGGLLLVDQELIHAPLRSVAGGVLAMPRQRPAPGSQDVGDAVLRGRFGTTPQAHASGTLVYSFPARWMDGYEPRCADPVLTWFEVGFEAPAANWRGLAWEEESADGTQRVRALARAGTASWEDDPRTTPGLVELKDGKTEQGGFLPLGLRADRLEIRFFFDWEPGSFDPQTFRATGWTQAPRVRRILLDYLAETRVESSAEVRE